MSKAKVKPMTADPMGIVRKLIGPCHSITDDSQKTKVLREMLPPVMIVQAINRLTEAVRENTEMARKQLNLNLERDANGR